MHVDVIIEESPDVITLQSEQFEMLTSLASTGIIPPGPNTLEVFIEASALRNKQRLIEKLKGGGELTPEQQQAQQMQQQMQEQAAQLELRGKAAQAQKDEASAQKTTVETAILTANAMEPQVQPMTQGGGNGKPA
jgi:hypothetical protein